MGRAYEVRKASMAKTSAAKAKLYSKFGKEIYMAAKNGEPDINLNANLKRVVEKAKSNQVPNDVITRAIDKAKGASKDDFENVLYEGFSISGTQVMVECLTDNVNRTVSDVRNCFTKTGGKIGVSGSLKHLFNHVALFVFSGCNDEEKILEKILENDLEYIEFEVEDELVTIQTEIQLYSDMRTVLETLENEIDFKVSEIVWIPQSYISLSGDDISVFEKLLSMLEECEDVQEVYHNVEY